MNTHNSETVVHLDIFKPREYQIPLFDAIENRGFKRVLAIMPRRAGKDICGFNLMLRQALRRVGVYYYLFPEFAQARRAIWDSITIDGFRFLDYIPSALIDKRNEQQMKITLVNGSIIQMAGSDNYNSLLGTNPVGIVFSEYAIQDPNAFIFLSPILVANNGWALFVGTPRGRENHMYQMLEVARANPERWYTHRLNLHDTQHISMESIEQEIKDGIISPDLVQQEYFCSFDIGIEGTYYGRYMDRLYFNRQIGVVPWEPSYPAFTAWDLGMNDNTTIIFAQAIGTQVRVIDCYTNHSQGLEHYAKIVLGKEYQYSNHFAPHDIEVRELGTGMSRKEKMQHFGINFQVAPRLEVMDGIEQVRTLLPRCWIDEKKCEPLVRALNNYRKEWDDKKKLYKERPRHDIYSHFCVAGDTQILTRYGMHPILEIGNGDEILTLEGWKPCLKAQKTRVNAEVVEVVFQDSTVVRCTPDHLFLTESGWICAESLERGTVIQSSLMKYLNTLMDVCIDYGRERNIFLARRSEAIAVCGVGCTGMYGEALLERFQKVVTYITEIIIPLTMHSTISNALKRESIEACLGLIVKDLLRVLYEKLLDGTDQKLAGNGIRSMLRSTLALTIGSESRDSAFSAASITKLSLERGDLLRSFAIPTVRPPIIEGVRLSSQKIDVWDITVPNVSHFSVSNGAILHNSDAMRYLALSIPKIAKQTTAEELRKRYNEAMMQDERRFPAPFNAPTGRWHN